MCSSAESYTLGFIGKVLGWSLDECNALIAKLVEQLRDPKIHSYTNWHFIYAQRPAEPTEA